MYFEILTHEIKLLTNKVFAIWFYDYSLIYTFDFHVELFAKKWELGGENPKQNQREFW